MLLVVWLNWELNWWGLTICRLSNSSQTTFQTHHALLSQGVVILEGLDLRAVPPGVYELFCLPLKIAGGSGDGAPARVVLRTLN